VFRTTTIEHNQIPVMTILVSQDWLCSHCSNHLNQGDAR
jgi:hypothetical protein